MDQTRFDIHQIDGIDYNDVEPILDDYEAALINLFTNSPEGWIYLQSNPTQTGFWIAQLIYYGYCHEGLTLSQMTKNDVQLVIEELLPRKISQLSPEDIDYAIPELIAFWQFLKRQFHLVRYTDKILAYLDKIKSKYSGIINDSSRFGTAKSFVIMGQNAGFDMTTEEGVKAFIHICNANNLSQLVFETKRLSSLLPELNPTEFDLDIATNSRQRKKSSEKRKKTDDIEKEGSKPKRKKSK
jgi:hypothetical protein